MPNPQEDKGSTKFLKKRLQMRHRFFPTVKRKVPLVQIKAQKMSLAKNLSSHN